jgi:uridine kinase
VFDVRSDRPLEVPAQVSRPGAVLVFDGLFIHRLELRGYWCYSIYLEAAERLALSRSEAASRLPGVHLDALEQRYVGGWRLYVAECHPENVASRVIDNDDFAAPTFVRRNGPHAAA